MRISSISLLPVMAALVLLSAFTMDSAAQSMPAGQVTGRARSASGANASKQLRQPSIDLTSLTSAKPPSQAAANPQNLSRSGNVNFDALVNSLSERVNIPSPAAGANAQTSCAPDTDANMATNALGSAAKAAWNAVVALDGTVPTPGAKSLNAARNLACLITDGVGLDWAQTLVANAETAAKTSKDDYSAMELGINAIREGLGDSKCWVTAKATVDPTDGKSSTTTSYHYPNAFPLFHNGCQSDDQILNFFTEGKTFDGGSQVQYLYNAQQSASSVSGDLLTTTFFPGIQVVLAGTATAGNGSTNAPTTNTMGTSFRTGRARPFDSGTDTSTTSTTDSVQTALTKLQNGGDFNVRVPVPLYNRQSDNGSIYAYFLPNVGFTLNGFGSQQTITESTQYSGNFPVELYGQIGSVKDPTGGSAAAIAFMDFKAAGEWISPQLAQKINLSGSTFFPILQASAGVEFAQKFRISMQYIYSTPQFCRVSGASTCASTTTGTATTGTQTKLSGFHLAVSFSPQKSSTAN